MTKDEYVTYLASGHWRDTREAALERAGRRCQLCNGAKRLDVHHRTYERVGAEHPGDLTVLCRGCHEHFHGVGDKKKRHLAAQPIAPDNWSMLAADEQQKLREQVARFLSEQGPATSKRLAGCCDRRTQVVGSCLVDMRRRGLVGKHKSRWWIKNGPA